MDRLGGVTSPPAVDRNVDTHGGLSTVMYHLRFGSARVTASHTRLQNQTTVSLAKTCFTGGISIYNSSHGAGAFLILYTTMATARK